MRSETVGNRRIPNMGLAFDVGHGSNGWAVLGNQEAVLLGCGRVIFQVVVVSVLLFSASLCSFAQQTSTAGHPVGTSEKTFHTIFDRLATGDQAGTEMLLGLAIQQNPGDQRLSFFEMACIRSRFDLEDTVPWARRTVKMNPSTPEGLCANLVSRLDRQENIDENMNALQLLVAAHPDNPLIRWMLAVQCRAFDRQIEGIRHYRALCNQMKRAPVLVNQTYGNLLEEACLLPEALVYRRVAVEQEQQNWSLHALGLTLNKLGRYEEAASIMGKNMEGWRACGTMAGLALLKLNRPSEALAALEKAGEYNPRDCWAWLYKGQALEKLGRFSDAAEAFIKAHYHNSRLWYLKGHAIELYTLAGKFDEARALQKSVAKEIHYERLPLPAKLVRAAETGDLDKVREFLDQGIGVESSSPESMHSTALMLAAKNGWGEVVDLLLTRGAKPDAQDNDMVTALMYAVRQHQTHSVQRLLKAGANVNLQNKAGQTALCLAVAEINSVAVRLLLEKGADPNISSDFGSPLYYAVCADGDDTGIAELLRKAGVNVNAPTPDTGTTPLMRACDYNRWNHFAQFIEWKADPNLRDKAGRTALMHALMAEGRSTYKQAYMQARVRILVEHGANVNIADNAGQTALDYAARVGAAELADYLRKHGAQRGIPRFPLWQFSTNVTSEIRQRAVAATTPLLMWEGGEFGCCGGVEKRRDINIKYALNANWALKDEGEFRMRLEGFRHQCDSADLAQLVKLGAEDLKITAMRDPAHCIRAMALQRERAVAGAGPKLSEDAVMAWDLIRYMHLCGIGMTLKYLKEGEGWQRIEEAEALLEKRFASWDEVAASFRLGQKLYDAKDTPDYDEIFKLLARRDDPNHPWRRVAWRTGPGSMVLVTDKAASSAKQ